MTVDKEAEADCNEAITNVNKGLFADPSKMTIAEYLTMYLEIHAEPNNKPTSYVHKFIFSL